MCGELKRARNGHGVIIQDGEFVIVGGQDENGSDKPVFTERCTLQGDRIQCAVVKPKLAKYRHYPEMIAVPHDYCPK